MKKILTRSFSIEPDFDPNGIGLMSLEDIGNETGLKLEAIMSQKNNNKNVSSFNGDLFQVRGLDAPHSKFVPRESKYFFPNFKVASQAFIKLDLQKYALKKDSRVFIPYLNKTGRRLVLVVTNLNKKLFPVTYIHSSNDIWYIKSKKPGHEKIKAYVLLKENPEPLL